MKDYWIVNLVDRVLEVYRRPLVDAAAQGRVAAGWGDARGQELGLVLRTS